jgi:hypothetical protein
MAWKAKTTRVRESVRESDPTDENSERPLEIAGLLDKVSKHLQEGNVERALEAIVRSKLRSSWAVNANGVCLLRLGRAKQAVDLFRGLVLAPGGMAFRADAPPAFRINFATALLADDNLGGCLSILHAINDEENPAVRQLRDAIQRFRDGISLWKRLQWRLGMPPSGRVAMDFPLGNLE